VGSTLSWRDELLTALVPHAVHRLGNLLTVVMGTADLLALDEADAARASELGVIGANTRRATELIRALGLHARSQPGESMALDLRDATGSLAELASPVAKAAGYTFEVREPAGVTVVRADPSRLQLLLLGLIVSAAQPGDALARREGSLTVRALELGTRVAVLISLRVHDGTGAPAIELDPRAIVLADELGATLHVRAHPGGSGQSLLLGLPGLA
jgi:C4-dicarboxylate-specific signal transduction histidine kinase